MAHSGRDTSDQEGLGWWEMSFLPSSLLWWFRALQMVYPEGDRGTEALAAAVGSGVWVGLAELAGAWSPKHPVPLQFHGGMGVRQRN